MKIKASIRASIFHGKGAKWSVSTILQTQLSADNEMKKVRTESDTDRT